MNHLTPCQKIKREILAMAKADDPEDFPWPAAIDLDGNIENAYEALVEAEWHVDYEDNFREGQVETDIPVASTRHYEAKSVAHQLKDGSWVGWTYWYGGGKHAEPEAIDWMQDAYNLNCVETEEVVTVRKFTRP